MAEWFKGVVIDSETLTPEIGENWRLNASCIRIINMLPIHDKHCERRLCELTNCYDSSNYS